MHSLLALLAQESSDSAGSAGILNILILLVIPVALYFLMIRPQRRRAKAAADMVRALGVGDEVITNSGIYGFITGEEDGLFWLEIDDDVQIRIAKAAIQSKVAPKDAAPAKPEKSGKDDDGDNPLIQKA